MRPLVDLQVNGFAGVDFSAPTLTRAGIERVCVELLTRGTGAFLPTVVTASWDVYEYVLPLLAEAVFRPPAGARILGLHLEGPFISPEPGAVGAHSPQQVQPPSLHAFSRLQNLSQKTIKLLTLAPERPGAGELIRAAVRSGIIVSIGHTLGAAEDMQRAVAAGARLLTHLGNGCPNTLHRHNNPIVAQLASGLQPMIIADGHHLPPAFVRMVERITGSSGLIVVSDSSSIAGLPPGDYESFGRPVRLEANRRLSCRDRDCLAGSSASLADCIHWLSEHGWTESELVAAGRDNPLRILGLTESEVQ